MPARCAAGSSTTPRLRTWRTSRANRRRCPRAGAVIRASDACPGDRPIVPVNGAAGMRTPGRSSETAHPSPSRHHTMPGSQRTMALAGMIIERAAGGTPADAISKRIARPLGLTGTSLPRGADTKIRGPHSRRCSKAPRDRPQRQDLRSDGAEPVTALGRRRHDLQRSTADPHSVVTSSQLGVLQRGNEVFGRWVRGRVRAPIEVPPREPFPFAKSRAMKG
ncbi:beta-lactamase family protein [Nonomuraea turkmeniaca]|uniref:Beta-lactamase family protein n=1 Tax=Nonomuraea turkmeniaca TaxID=103838 RepID=A0A5S4FC56_9ACTN|nr:beta-lactamase family protein [Nonomuraea turkmeniaca]